MSVSPPVRTADWPVMTRGRPVARWRPLETEMVAPLAEDEVSFSTRLLAWNSISLSGSVLASPLEFI